MVSQIVGFSTALIDDLHKAVLLFMESPEKVSGMFTLAQNQVFEHGHIDGAEQDLRRSVEGHAPESKDLSSSGGGTRSSFPVISNTCSGDAV